MFQSTHPHGVRQVYFTIFLSFISFQSTHPHGVRLPCGHCDPCLVRFQSTHPHGVRLKLIILICSRSTRFNPRTRMGCDRQELIRFCLIKGFNPRTRMGCDAVCIAIGIRYIVVSIHAPAWGATSIYTLLNAARRFQSTHPHGVRLPFLKLLSLPSKVSIHAPAWGAT